MPAADYSTPNIINSISLELAARFLTAGYVLYWHRLDALQTSTIDWYYNYSTTYETRLADAAFLGLLTAAKGILTITDSVPALPRYTVRPINSGAVPAEDEVMVPSLAVLLGPAIDLSSAEMGSDLKNWARRLELDTYLRTTDEQGLFQDLFPLWFKGDATFAIKNHVAGTLADVGTVVVGRSQTATLTVIDNSLAQTFEVAMQAKLDYVA